MKSRLQISARFWSAPALWRFGIVWPVMEKRQRAGAVQDTVAQSEHFTEA